LTPSRRSSQLLKRQFHFFQLLFRFLREFEPKSFRGLIGLWEIQSVHGLTPEFGGDAEVALRGLDRLVAGERLDIGDVAAGLQQAR
jgi:hypothetical protein